MREVSDMRYEIDETREDVRSLDRSHDELAKRVARLEDMLKHLAQHAGTSPTAAGKYVVDVLSTS